MKIGILTYYRSHNYGAMLQAVALRRVLQDMGHSVFYLDYWPQHQKNIYMLFDWEVFWRGGFRHKVHCLRLFLKTLIPKLMRRYNFYHFYRINIRPFVRSKKDQYDVIVYGSDQIWRKQGWGYGYNPVYFGKNGFNASKHVSYAASMGSLPDNPEDIQTIREYFNCLDVISVREEELQRFLKEQYSIYSEHTIDPTFLLTKEEWKGFVGKKRIISQPYLLFYDLQEGAFNTKEVDAFASKIGLQVIRISGKADYMPRPSDRNTDGPFEFLNLVCYADFVITSSFHGLVFALIFQKPFFIRSIENRSRVESLLSIVNLRKRLLANNQRLPDDRIDAIDWYSVQTILTNEKMKSLKYILDAI